MKKVSGLAINPFYVYMEEHGIERKKIQEGLPYSPEYLNNPFNWIDYETWLEIEKRFGDIFRDDREVFYKCGLIIGKPGKVGFLRPFTRALISPQLVYRRMPILTRRFLFRFFDLRFEHISPAKLRGWYIFEKDCPPSEAFFEAARGVYTGVQMMLGFPPPEVKFTRIDEQRFYVDIEVAQLSGPIGFIQSRVGEAVRHFRLRLKSPFEAAHELEDTNRKLQEKVEALSDLSENLDKKVKERTVELDVAMGKLAHTVKSLEQADQAKSAFFTNVSHELKTPLTLILAPLHDLENTLRQAGMKSELESLQMVRRHGQALYKLVNEILDFSRMDDNRMPTKKETFELNHFIEDMVASMKILADRQQISLDFKSSVKSIILRADPKLMRRMMLNLIMNALKYSNPGDAVHIGTTVIKKQIKIEVRDTGIGIPKSQQERIFERFQRVHDSQGRKVEGSGIGLAMVKEIVQLHNGTIELDSEEEQGSVFRICLPRPSKKAAGSPIDRVAPLQPLGEELPELMTLLEGVPEAFLDSTVEEDSNGSMCPRLLIADDTPEMLNYMVRLLRPYYNILTASDGLEALELARKELPDIILSDVMMPRMNGYELCRQLKKATSTSNIPLILITARHGSEAAVEGFEAGDDDYVVKPFSPHELKARLHAQARLRTLTKNLIRAEKKNTQAILSSGIAHEVLNPVNALINAVPPLRKIIGRMIGDDAKLNDLETSEALLKVIELSGDRITKIIRDINNLTKQGEAELETREIRLSEGIESVISILNYRLKRGYKIHRDYRWDEKIIGYPQLIDQVVMNLLVNALDALPPSGGNIWVTTEMADGAVRIEVADDGPGIPPEKREQIFTPFFTTKPPGSGTGLGLAISREIVSLHKGTLELDTKAEGGAAFVIVLPMAKTDSPINRGEVRNHEA